MTTSVDPPTFPKGGHGSPPSGRSWARPCSPRQTQEARQRERVRSERHEVAMLRDMVRLVPERVTAPVRQFIAGLDALQRAPPFTYAQVYAAYTLARARAKERQDYLIDYGHALLDALPDGSPAARELTTRLARTVAFDGHSLAGLLTSQCALDRALANAERSVA
ncbi:MAG: hypothetical protein H0X24_01860 [Ktedonobacterales bacterium]|nr:hypothetical protein [Ktedonobacterales bacterium]